MADLFGVERAGDFVQAPGTDEAEPLLDWLGLERGHGLDDAQEGFDVGGGGRASRFPAGLPAVMFVWLAV